MCTAHTSAPTWHMGNARGKLKQVEGGVCVCVCVYTPETCKVPGTCTVLALCVQWVPVPLDCDYSISSVHVHVICILHLLLHVIFSVILRVISCLILRIILLPLINLCLVNQPVKCDRIINYPGQQDATY